MKKNILFMLIMLIGISAFAQNSWKAHVVSAETKLPVAGVTAALKGLSINTKSDENGSLVLNNIPNGEQTIVVSFVGFKEQIFKLNFPINQATAEEIRLETSEDELETVVISSTRSSRSIKDIPTRIEFIAGEELEEKANMKPGDIRMLLNESTGVQTQQTSAISANAAIRIQGLDGRYTQLLKDGFPLYAGAASGLGLLQIQPLDLKQVELIKGSASTLYGAGAIAGLVNLISKTPKKEQELNFHIDGTDALGLSLNGFYSKRNDKAGTTLFAAYQKNRAYDPAGIDLSAIPKSERFAFNPKLFLYPNANTTIILGANATFENRIGGDMHFIAGEPDEAHTYFERNKSQRVNTQFSVEHRLSKTAQWNLKNSLSYFNRILTTPGYEFNGNQYSTFTEFNYAYHGENVEWIGGANLLTDQFREKSNLRNEQQLTVGTFVQNNLKATAWLNLETGLRIDHVKNYGFAVLPRLSTLFKLNNQLTSRLGGGLGYKAPTIFTEDSERIQYRNVLGIDKNINELERSYGANWDINYRTALIDQTVSLTINHLFYFTHLKNPLQLVALTGGNYQLVNASGNMESKGTETNVKLGYEDFKLFLGYTYTDAHRHQNGIQIANPLTAKHRVNAVLMYELEDQWKLGLEAYTFSKQLLTDNTVGKPYTIMGFMAEKIWKRFSVYINFENFTNVRQTRFDSIYTGTLTNPQFRDIYAPLDGFVMNGGIKVRL